MPRGIYQRTGIKRGPYKRTGKYASKVSGRSITLLDENGKKNYYQIKKLEKSIRDKFGEGTSAADYRINKLRAEIEFYKEDGKKFTNLSWNTIEKNTYDEDREDRTARDRMLSNMGMSMDDLVNNLGAESVMDIQWIDNDPTEKSWSNSDSYTFIYNGEKYRLAFDYTYSGVGYEKVE